MPMEGMNRAHALRLFGTGKRRAWTGAKGLFERANAEVEERE